jgi:peptidoglycan/LPS O-acetylase OafA/YrhL
VRERTAFAGFFRAFATFAIVAYHVWLLDINYKPAEAPGLVSLAMWGQFAVACFFTLSGFLLGRPFLRAILERRPLPSWRGFARDRFLRIYPLYAFATLLSTALAGVVRQTPAPPSVLDVASHLALVQSWFHAYALGVSPPYWTMSTDAQFYVVLPLIAFALSKLGGTTDLARTRNLGLGLFTLCVLSFALRLARSGDAATATHDYAFFVVAFGNVPAMFVAFGGGMIAAFVWIVTGEKKRRRLAAALAVAALPPLVLALDQQPRTEVATIVFNPVLDAIAATFLLFAGLSSPARWWNHTWIAWAERLSYGVYLFHFGVLKMVDRVALPLGAWPYFGLTLLIGYVLSLAIALPAYVVIERPFLRWKARLRDDRADGLAFVRTSAP